MCRCAGWEDRRAAGLPLLYKRALDRHYTSCHHTLAGQTGPLVRRLQSYGKLEGLVVGPWVEGSKDLHSLVKVLAETKLAAKARSLERKMSDKELGIIATHVRKYLYLLHQGIEPVFCILKASLTLTLVIPYFSNYCFCKIISGHNKC